MFDIRVVDTDSQSYRDRTPLAVLSSAKHEKKRKYSLACQTRRATFTPVCMSVNGMMGCGATAFLKWVADRLSAKWGKAYGSVMEWIRTRLSFATLMPHYYVFRGVTLVSAHWVLLMGHPLMMFKFCLLM